MRRGVGATFGPLGASFAKPIEHSGERTMIPEISTSADATMFAASVPSGTAGNQVFLLRSTPSRHRKSTPGAQKRSEMRTSSVLS